MRSPPASASASPSVPDGTLAPTTRAAQGTGLEEGTARKPEAALGPVRGWPDPMPLDLGSAGPVQLIKPQRTRRLQRSLWERSPDRAPRSLRPPRFRGRDAHSVQVSGNGHGSGFRLRSQLRRDSAFGSPVTRAEAIWRKVRLKEAVGRILFPGGRRPFLLASRHREAPAAYPGASSAVADGGDGRPSTPLFGLAPHGVYRALSVTGQAVRSYRTLSPLPPVGSEGGLLSVALSLALPRPGVTRHAARLESGPSSEPAGAQRTPTSSSRTRQL